MPTAFVSNKDALPKRRAHDFYQTEHNLIQAVMDVLRPDNPFSVLDLGAADGRWGHGLVDYLANHAMRLPLLSGIDIRELPRPEYFTQWYSPANFLDPDVQGQMKKDRLGGYDVILSNPPFKYAEEFVRGGWDLLAFGGVMAYLLPIAFMATQTRYFGLWNELHPAHVYVCSRRPSFYKSEKSRTNLDDFAIYVWMKNYNGMPVGLPRQWQTSLLYYEADE